MDCENAYVTWQNAGGIIKFWYAIDIISFHFISSLIMRFCSIIYQDFIIPLAFYQITYALYHVIKNIGRF